MSESIIDIFAKHADERLRVVGAYNGLLNSVPETVPGMPPAPSAGTYAPVIRLFPRDPAR